MAGKLLEPIPQIKFDHQPHEGVRKNLQEHMDYARQSGLSSEGFMLLVDWILWFLNTKLISEFPNRIPEALSWEWCITFNMGFMLKHQADHIVWASCNLVNDRGFGNDYLPTSIHICQMMTDMNYSNSNSQEAKRGLVNDPCMGTGPILLAASNYSLRLTGMDISLSYSQDRYCKCLSLHAMDDQPTSRGFPVEFG